MLKYLLTIVSILYYLDAQTQLWQQVGGNENGFFGGLYGDTVTNSLYAQALIFPPGDTVWGFLRFDGEEWVVVTEFEPFGGNGSFVRYQGDLIYGSGFMLPGDSIYTNIAKWDEGNNWERMGSKGGVFDSAPVNDLLVHEGYLYAAGRLKQVDSIEARGIGKWDGEQWTGMRPGRFHYSSPQVFAMAVYQGELYVGGYFRLIDLNEWNITKWDGDDWDSVGGGLGLTDFSCGFAVNDMEVYKDELYIGGCFPLIPAQVGHHIVKWDGYEYKSIGAEEPDYIDKMVIFNDELYIAGRFGVLSEIGETDVAKWDGTKWCSLGSVFSGKIDDMEVFNGELYVSGDFTHINGEPFRGVVKWVGDDYVAACGTPVSNDELIVDKKFFRVYPNPSYGDLVIENKTMRPYQGKVYDVMGREVEAINSDGRQGPVHFDLNYLSKGIYFVHFHGGSWKETVKIIVQ